MEGDWKIPIAIISFIFAMFCLFTSKEANGLSWSEFFREKM